MSVSREILQRDLQNAFAGHVANVVARRFQLDPVNIPIHLYQTNGGHS